MTSVVSDNLPAYLATQFPGAVADIERIQSADPDTPALNAYAYIAEVVWSGSFEPAIDAGDEPAIRHCFRVTEDLLASDDQNLRTATSIRLTEHLAVQKLRPLVVEHAGPNLRRDLTRATGHDLREAGICH